MRNLGRLIYAVAFIILCCSVMFESGYVTSAYAEDKFSSYEAEVGYMYSILEFLPEADYELNQQVVVPTIEAYTDQYVIRVREMLADSLFLYINVELEVTNQNAIVRPDECKSETYRYYSPYATCESDLYYVGIGFSTDKTLFPSQYGIGIDSEESKINRLYCIPLSDEYNADTQADHLDLTINVQVDHVSAQQTISETTSIHVNCPVLDVVDWGKVVLDAEILDELQMWNISVSDLTLVQTPIRTYVIYNGLVPIDLNAPVLALAGFYEPDLGWLDSSTKLDTLPSNMYLWLFKQSPKFTTIKIWPIERNGNSYVANHLDGFSPAE